jgi:hypothetical protein
MGKSAGRRAETIQTNVSNKAMGLSDTLSAEAAPQRKLVGDFYESIVKGDPVNLARVRGPQLNLARDAYGQAQAQIERMLPKGGARDQAQTDLAIKQAGNLTSILSGGVDEAVQALTQLAQFGTGGSYQGMNIAGQSGESLARLSAARAQAVGMGIAGIGQGVGSAVGKGSMGSGKPTTTATTPTNTSVLRVAPAPYMTSPLPTQLTGGYYGGG